MKHIQNLKTINGGAREYDVTVDDYNMIVELLDMSLSDSFHLDLNSQTNPEWHFAPTHVEVRNDKNFDSPNIDFVLNVGIKLIKVDA